MKVLGVFLLLLLVYILWQYFELKKFRVTKYKCVSDKLRQKHSVVVLADLHGFSYGKNNEQLILAVKRENPELILIAGDMIVSKYTKTYEPALDVLRQLVKIAPVCYSFGNHESRAVRPGLTVSKAFLEYLAEVKKTGVKILRNESTDWKCGEDNFTIAGLEISLDYYKKGCEVPMEDGYMDSLLGNVKEERFTILLAHNPAYSEQYAAWGADVSFAGHNHGGLVRIPGIGSLLSPQFSFFPKYGDGCHYIGKKQVIISRGLGTHTFHIRIFNRAELLSVQLLPESERNDNKWN